MMRHARRYSTVLALLVAGACALSPGGVSTALAATGGTVSPGRAAPARPLARVPHRGAIATWFGPGFYGQRTACGQLLTPATIGVAHRTLPCGTLVSVGYHGRRLTLPVIDRGPYGNGAEWDLTSEAARALGIADTVRVSARVVGSVPNSATLGMPPQAAPAGGLVRTGGAVSG